VRCKYCDYSMTAPSNFNESLGDHGAGKVWTHEVYGEVCSVCCDRMDKAIYYQTMDSELAVTLLDEEFDNDDFYGN